MLWRLFCRRKRRKMRASDYSSKKVITENINFTSPDGCTATMEISEVSELSLHIAKYIGETVTIFVAGGGAAGLGFTGILLDVNEIYIRLITQIGPAPGCSLGNGCTYPALQGHAIGYFNYNTNNRVIGWMGAVANIPVTAITAFVHNTV
ncbi:MAG: hypothetical protein N3B21_15965 [Clostridia bacterium]|nr:hypothetical protein [Clostridia bacterium]